MDVPVCPLCKKPRGADPRAKFCCDKHRWRGWWQRSVAFSAQVQQLPLATLPADADELLPASGDRLLVSTQLVLIGRAPAGACGYRVGIKHGQSLLLRWFPAAKLREVPMFLLEPFEWAAVPVVGTYAVVYMDRRCRAIGGPRFSIAIDQVDSRLRYSDGDRTYKPRARVIET